MTVPLIRRGLNSSEAVVLTLAITGRSVSIVLFHAHKRCIDARRCAYRTFIAEKINGFR